MASLDPLAQLTAHPASRVSFSLPFSLSLVPPPDAHGRTRVERWVRHLRSDPRWAPPAGRSLRELDVALPSLACNREDWPVIVAPFRLEEAGRRALAGAGGHVLHVTRTGHATEVRDLVLDDVQLHVCRAGLAILHVSFVLGRAKPEDRALGAILEIVQSFRRMKSWDEAGARSAFLLAEGATDEQLDAARRLVLSSEMKDRRLSRVLPDLPPGVTGLLGHELAWSIVEWAAGRTGAGLARPTTDVGAAQREAIHDYFMRTYLRLPANAGDGWTREIESEILRRFALGEGARYAGGALGSADTGLVRRFDNLAENAWGVSSEGSACLVRTSEEGGFFDHVLPGLLAGPYLMGMHLAIFQRSILLDVAMQITAFARDRTRSWLGAHGLRGDVTAIREEVMQFNLEMHHLVVSTNPRHQALYECHRACYLIDELYAEVKEEVSELDEWLERLGRSTLEGLLTLISFVAMPIGLVLGFLSVGFAELSPPLSMTDPRVIAGLGGAFAAQVCMAGVWLLTSAWLQRRRARRSGRLAGP